MRINMAHLRDQGIDFAVFDTDARNRMDRDRALLLQRLVVTAQGTGLKIDKAALAFTQGNRMGFYPYSDTCAHCQNLPLQNGHFAGVGNQGHACLECP